MSWTSSTLSTTDSIVRHLSRILSITNYTTGSGGQWDMKFDLARLKLGNDLQSRFGFNYNINDITNKDSLTLASDYLTLALVYTLLSSNGLNLAWLLKKEHYWKQYAYELTSCIPRIQFSNSYVTAVSGYLEL